MTRAVYCTCKHCKKYCSISGLINYKILFVCANYPSSLFSSYQLNAHFLCCTLPLHYYLCWRMPYVTIVLLSQPTYAVRYHSIVVSSDVCFTLPFHCCLFWRMLYVTIALLCLLTYDALYHPRISNFLAFWPVTNDISDKEYSSTVGPCSVPE